MGDIEDLKQAVHRDVVIPLSEFQAKAQALDTVHDQCVQEFQNAIQALFGPSSTFNGAAADAIAELAGKYLSAERALGDYTSNSLSYRLGSATHLCQTTVAELEPLLAALHDFPAAQAFIAATGAVKEALPPTEESLPPPDNPSSFAIWLAGLVIVLAGAGTLAFMVEYNDQQMKANQIDQAIRQWQGGMRDLAAQPESKLPPEPTDPKPFLASPGSMLYLNPNLPPYNSMSQEQLLVQDIMRELQRLGITANQSDVENLVKLGYNRVSIIFILSQSPRPPVGQIPSANVLLSAGASLDANGRTAAGRAFQKHGSRNPSIWGTPQGNQAALNKEGQDLLDLIVNSPDTIWQVRHHARFGDVIEAKLPDGRGARWSADGKTFIGFLDP